MITELGRNKIIVLGDRFDTGEPTVRPVLLWSLHGKPCYEPFTKEASQSPALEYIKTIQPVPGRTIVLVIGLGSFERYGLNRNGDGFNEQPYKIGLKPKCGCCSGRDAWVLEEECIQNHYKTYEQGHVYKHHVNKDPAKSIGKILKAFWNPFMHRIEVLEDIDNAKAPDIVERIADGEFPAKSMGTRIKFDVCTVCGHRAPTRKQYCDHLKWEMGQLDPKTGIRTGALNPSPRFFDSSWVVRPADRTGYMLKKVANTYEVQGENMSSGEMGDLVDALNEKSATAQKLAVIDKVVRGYPAGIVGGEFPEASLIEKYKNESAPDVVANTPELSHGDLSTLAPHDLPKTLAALSEAGILLTTPEFVQLFIEKAMPGTKVPKEVLDNLVALQSEIFSLLSESPSTLKDLEDTLTPSNGEDDPKISAAITPLLEKRSTLQPYLYRRLTPKMFRHDEPAMTDLMEYVDPESGRLFQTTRGAARTAEDSIGRSKLLKLVGSGGLLAGAYKTMLTPKMRLAALPLAGASWMLGQSAMKPTPQYRTTSGDEVPYLTEFMEKRSNLMDITNNLAMDYGITKKGNQTVQRVRSRVTASHPLHLFIQKISSLGLQHPKLSLHKVITAHEKTAQTGIFDDGLNLLKTAEVIGTLVWMTS